MMNKNWLQDVSREKDALNILQHYLIFSTSFWKFNVFYSHDNIPNKIFSS